MLVKQRLVEYAVIKLGYKVGDRTLQRIGLCLAIKPARPFRVAYIEIKL